MVYLQEKLERISSYLSDAECAESNQALIVACCRVVLEATDDDLLDAAVLGLMAYELRETCMEASEEQRAALRKIAAFKPGVAA